MRKAQILLTTLIILMIISLIVIFITSTVIKSGRMTALNYEYKAAYNNAEMNLLFLIDQLKTSDIDFEDISHELSKNDWDCKESLHVKRGYVCQNDVLGDNGMETVIQIARDNTVLNYELAKEDYFDLILNDGFSGNYKGLVNLSWLGDSALELTFVYQTPQGELKNLVEILDSNTNPVYHSTGNGQSSIFNHNLSSIENELSLDFNQINYKVVPPRSIFKYLRIKSISKMEGTVINIRPQVTGNQLPDQVITLSAVSYVKNKVESASPVVFSQIPLSPQLPPVLNMGLNAKSLKKPLCGNNVREGAEICDDGNTNDSDGCTSECLGPAAICEAETMANGTFEDPAMKFVTNYERGSLYLEGHYEITDNPKTFHGAFGACKDITSGKGNMLVVNGDSIEGQKIICQNIKGLKQDSNYKFSLWLTSVSPKSPAHVWMSINDEFVKDIQLSSNVCDWQEYVGFWNSKNYREAEVCLIDKNTATQGNDFAIDEVSFKLHCGPLPEICDINLDSAGGDDGYEETFKLDSFSAETKLKIEFEPFSKKDKLIVSTNNGTKYDSGCVGDRKGTDFNYSGDITIDENDEELTIKVKPNCTGGTGTAWKLRVKCL
jgi:cysteine-rich repeat protein